MKRESNRTGNATNHTMQKSEKPLEFMRGEIRTVLFVASIMRVGLTTQAQRRRPRDAAIATVMRCRRMVVKAHPGAGHLEAGGITPTSSSKRQAMRAALCEPGQ